jgi:hypothetical protein
MRTGLTRRGDVSIARGWNRLPLCLFLLAAASWVGPVWPSASRRARTNNKHLRSQSRFGVALLAAIKAGESHHGTAALHIVFHEQQSCRHAASSQGTAHLRLSRRAWCRRRRKRSCLASAQPPRRAHHCGRHPLRDISVRLRCAMFRSCHAKSRLFRPDVTKSRSSLAFSATASVRLATRMTRMMSAATPWSSPACVNIDMQHR